MAARKLSRPPARAALVRTVTDALDDMKAVNVKVLDVRQVTDVSDCMVLASGNSDRHVRSIADRVVELAKAGGFRPLGVEGQRDGEWVLVDLNDVLVHVMLPRVREFYGLEELWEAPAVKPPSRRRSAGSGARAKKAPRKSGTVRKSAGSRPAAKAAGSKAAGSTRAGAGAAGPRTKASKAAPRKSSTGARGKARPAAAPARRAKKSAARGARSRA